MYIKVNDILDLMPNCSIIQIYVSGDTYEFPVYELPNEVKHMTVLTIDDPYYSEKPHPLCLNLSEDENFDDYKKFRETYKECILLF